MELIPFKQVTNVPYGGGGLVNVLKTDEFIDIAKFFPINVVMGDRESYYTGLTAYMNESLLMFCFDSNYKITDVEFRAPFEIPEADILTIRGTNLLLPTLKDVQGALQKIDITVQEIDVGIEAPSIGVSFFSTDFEDDLNVKLDAVTVHFNQSINKVS